MKIASFKNPSLASSLIKRELILSSLMSKNKTQRVKVTHYDPLYRGLPVDPRFQ